MQSAPHTQNSTYMGRIELMRIALQDWGHRAYAGIARFNASPIATTVTLGVAFLAVLVMLTFSSCQSLGVPALDTFNKKAAAGYTAVTAVRDTATTLLTAHKISAVDALSVQTQADNAREAITIARSVHLTDPAKADNALQITLQTIAALQSYLQQRARQ